MTRYFMWQIRTFPLAASAIAVLETTTEKRDLKLFLIEKAFSAGHSAPTYPCDFRHTRGN